MTSLMEFFQTIPEFAEFSQSELSALDKAFRVETYPVDHVFMRYGEHPDALYLILGGEIHIKRRRQHKAGYALVTTLHSGEMFGLLSLIDNAKRSATAVGATEAKVATLPQSAFELLLDTHAPIALHFQGLVARQLARDLRRYDEALRAVLRSGDVNEISSTLA